MQLTFFTPLPPVHLYYHIFTGNIANIQWIMDTMDNGLKDVWEPKKKGPVQLKSADGMETFSDSKRVVARWSEHFQKLLNVPGDIDHEALDNIPQSIIKTSLDDIPTMDEMAKAIAGLKDGKAPGGDGIPAEVWKHGGDNLFSRLHQLITNAWEVGSVPQAWKDASIVTIYKKGDRTDCGNYRGISLLSIAGKIFARILLNRLSTHITPEVVPETQCGFRGNRSTVDVIFCLRQLQEKCIEQDRPLYMVFVDFSKAFDTVGRTGLWQLLRKYGCPEKFTTMIEALHTGMMANVSVGGEVSESFSVTNGVKQGCVLAPTLFSIFLSAMLDDAFRDMRDGVYIQSRQSADLFNVAHFRAKTKTTRILMRELLFADDSALVAHSAEEMQNIVDAFSNASKKFGLKINITKTEVLYQPNSTRTREEDIMVDGNKLNYVLEFTYLGSTISSDGCIDDEIQSRIATASASFGRLSQRLWNNHHVSMRVKGKIYRAIVLSTLLYGARGLDSVQTTGEKAACLHDATSAIDHEDNLDGQSDKQGNTRTDRTAIYGRSSDQKESPVDWTPHEDVTRQATKAGSLLPTVFWSEKERAPSSPVQGYHQEKPEAERHKDRLLDITLTAER